MRPKCEKRSSHWTHEIFQFCSTAELIIARLVIFALFLVGLLKLIGCKSPLS
jgi:hypothetical protein